MEAMLYNLIPNVVEKGEDFFQAIWDTLVMAGWAGAFIFAFGMTVGIILTVTKSGGILPHPAVYQVFDKTVNLFRSIPFVILLAGLMPLSRLIMGSAIGVKGAIVPLERFHFIPDRWKRPWRSLIREKSKLPSPWDAAFRA